MIAEHELLATVERLQIESLRRWIAHGWVAAHEHEGCYVFQEVDVARVRLICDLVYDIEMDEESLPVVLSLLDQLHDTRRLLKRFSAVIDGLPDDMRREIKAALEAEG